MGGHRADPQLTPPGREGAQTDPLAPEPLEDRHIFELLGFD